MNERAMMLAFLASMMHRAWMLHAEVLQNVRLYLARVSEGGAGGMAGAELRPEEMLAAMRIRAGGPGKIAGSLGGGKPGGSEPEYQLVSGVAVIDVWGVLDKSDADVSYGTYRWGTSYESIRRQTRAAMADTNVKAVLYRIDSPGGAAMSVGPLAEEMFSVRGQGGKPTYAYNESGLMASAALYLGAQAGTVWVAPGSWSGSIGTILQVEDWSAYLAKIGIRIEAIVSTPTKDVGSPYRAMTAEDRAILQAEVNEYDRQFVAALAKGRGVDVAAVRKWQSDHGYIGQQAVAAGMADAVKNTIDDVIAAIAAIANGKDNRNGQSAGTRLAAPATPSAGAAGEAAPAQWRMAAGTARSAKMNKKYKVDGQGRFLLDASGNLIRDDVNGRELAADACFVMAEAGAAFVLSAATAALAGVAAPANPANPTPAPAAFQLTAGDIQARAAGISARASLGMFAGSKAVKDLLGKAMANLGEWTPEKFSDACVEALAKENPPTGHVPNGGVSVTAGQEQSEKVSQALSHALFLRSAEPLLSRIASRTVAGVGVQEKEATANRMAVAMGFASADDVAKSMREDRAGGLRGRRLEDIGRRFIAACLGVSVEATYQQQPSDLDVFNAVMGRNRVRASGPAGHSSSDFPSILLNAQNKVLLAGFAEAPRVWDKVCRRGTVNDYKAQPRVSLSEAANFEQIPEGKRPSEQTFNDRREQLLVNPFGRQFSYTYQMWRNDDLGAFSQWSRLIGDAAARVPEDLFITALKANSNLGPTMLQDNTAFFNSAHNNIATAAALAYASAWAAWVAMAKQKGFGQDKAPIDISPTVMLVPTDLIQIALDIAMQEYAPGTTGAQLQRNTLRGRFEVAATPRLTGTRWWFFHNSSQAAPFEVGFLDGQETPVITEDNDGDPLSKSFQATLPGVGITPLQYEAGITNAGG